MSSIANPINEEVVSENLVKQEAEKSISFTCQKHRVSREELRPEVISAAYSDARIKIEQEKALAADPSYVALQGEREKNRLLQLQVEALSAVKPYNTESTVGTKTGQRVVSSSTTPGDLARLRMGEAAWWGMTEAGRLASSGVAPSEVTPAVRQEISELFGKRANSSRASDLAKTSPERYKFLRNVARTLDLFGR
jgi:hypothetical protein